MLEYACYDTLIAGLAGYLDIYIRGQVAFSHHLDTFTSPPLVLSLREWGI